MPRISADSRDSRRRLGVLQQIVETVNSTLNLEDVLQHIVELVSGVAEADACHLYLLDGGRKSLILRAAKPVRANTIGKLSLGPGEGVSGWVARRRCPVALSKGASQDPRFKAFQQLPEDRYEAILCVPIFCRDKVTGVINVQHRKGREYGSQLVGLVESIGRLVGSAIANAALYEEVSQRKAELATLSRVSAAVASAHYLDEILRLIVTVTAELMHSKICSLMLLDGTGQHLVIRATQALSKEYRSKPPIPVGKSISGLVVKGGKPIAVANVAQDPRYLYRDLAKKAGLRSLLSVPMMVNGKAIGAINCYTCQEHSFTGSQTALLQTIADQAALAIQHTRLLDEASSARKALEERKLVERAKGILMDALKIPEEAAFRVLQERSMKTRAPMAEIARALMLSRDLTSPSS